MPSPGGFLGGSGVVQVIPAVAIKAVAYSGSFRDRSSIVDGQGCVVLVPTPEPWEVVFGAYWLLAAIFFPLDGAGLGAKNTGPGFAPFAQLGIEEGADVEAYPVVDVGIPTD